jgi:hypothetical protein
MKILDQLLLASIVLTFSVSSATAQHTYSKAVQKACANDYRSHCGQYGIETDALRLCMDKAGQALSKTCVDALVDAGEVSKKEHLLGHEVLRPHYSPAHSFTSTTSGVTLRYWHCSTRS